MLTHLKSLLLSLIVAASIGLNAQGFLHTSGKNIVTGAEENFIIRSIGTGNWLIMEGYMMQTGGDAGTHTGFRNKLIETMGVAYTDSFYTKWNHDHMRKIDVDSLAAWGFNSIRVAMHYKWLTLPIEDEPVPGEQTWLEPGFVLLDSLLKWCSENEMYLILDMHGAPGGQGYERAISDYDPDFKSLWESEANKTKLVALWYKLAERYSSEPWIGGYDLINEPNWNLSGNTALWELQERITDTIRLVDQNHIVIIEGNWFANNFDGFSGTWDDNFVFGPHKYWSYNNVNSVDWLNDLRDTYNAPVWIGETGENSNSWFTNLVRRAEQNNIGWSLWPVKNVDISNPLNVTKNKTYGDLVDYWEGRGTKPTPEAALDAVLQFSENHRFENCLIQRDVNDALFRQPFTRELKPFKIFHPDDYIYVTDYALGRNGFAYYDKDTATYHVSTGSFEAWNQGYQYRNDGVDIQECEDTLTNGYNIGWTEDGEWMVYHIQNDSTTMYDCTIRHASGSSYAVFEVDGKIVSNEILLQSTGQYQVYRSTITNDIVLPAGLIELKLKIPDGGANLNYFTFSNPRSAVDDPFRALYCETGELGRDIFIHLNRDITSQNIAIEDFELFINGESSPIASVRKSEESDRVIILTTGEYVVSSWNIKLSYNGNSIFNNEVGLQIFDQKVVVNNLYREIIVPGKFEAEDYYTNVGLELEDCKDTGEGKNTGFANPGDYLDYILYVLKTGEYKAEFRVATERSNAQITILYEEDGAFVPVKDMAITSTGGWQKWETQSTVVTLPEGVYKFRIRIKQGEHNLNWIKISVYSGIETAVTEERARIYPNPAGEFVNIEFPNGNNKGRSMALYTINGKIAWSSQSFDANQVINTSKLGRGVYMLQVIEEESAEYYKIILN